jgi:hypothetical protein
VVAYQFYTVDPTTGVATMFSTCDNFTGISCWGFCGNALVDAYCGWFDEVSNDGSLVYRLGYQNVVQQQGFGLGITGNAGFNKILLGIDLSQPNAVDKFYAVPLPQNYDNYVSLSLYKDGFISLSPDSTWGNLAVVKVNEYENNSLNCV